MQDQVENSISGIRRHWTNPTMDSVLAIEAIIAGLAHDQDVLADLARQLRDSPQGVELHRDQEHGFILVAYSEKQGQYRVPHNHGDAWVIYAVLAGEVEMGTYFKFALQGDKYRLVLKDRERLSTGDTRIYFPGDIHDTHCVSTETIILRLTSMDLKTEERLGRMNRYQSEHEV